MVPTTKGVNTKCKDNLRMVETYSPLKVFLLLGQFVVCPNLVPHLGNASNPYKHK
jgi:hypothetical protein